jgi:hypothetical protein
MHTLTLLCAATRIEARACWAGILRAQAQSRFEILRTGMGDDRARFGLRARLENSRLPRPSLIISTGFAGSTAAELPPGFWASGRSIRSENGKTHLLDTKVRDLFLANERHKRIAHADFVSLIRPKSAPSFSASGNAPTLVDMESSAWAGVAHAYEIPYLILRLVSDTPESPLPSAIEHFATAAVCEEPLERLRCVLRGTRHSLSAPKTMAMFLMKSSQLPMRLSEGWAEFASEEALNESVCTRRSS